MRRLQLKQQITVRSQTLWYTLWSALLVISAGNALPVYAFFSCDLGFVFSILLAACLGIQWTRGVLFLSQKEAGLAGALLFVFTLSQFGYWVRSLASPAMYRGFDFSAYYLAAKFVSTHGGRELYALPLYADGRMNLLVSAPTYSTWYAAALQNNVPYSAPYIYPPFFAVLIDPIAHLSFKVAYVVWDVLTVVLVACSVLLILSLAKVKISSKLILILGVGIFSYYPLSQCLFTGQVGGVILFLLVASVWLLQRNNPSLSALSFAAATMIKLTPLLALPLLIFHRRWKWLIAYVTWMGTLTVYPSCGLGGTFISSSGRRSYLESRVVLLWT